MSDLHIARLRSSHTTTSAVVDSSASVLVEVRSIERSRYDRCSCQMEINEVFLQAEGRSVPEIRQGQQ